MEMQIQYEEPIEQVEFELENKSGSQGILRQLYFTKSKELLPVLLRINEDKEIIKQLKTHYGKLSVESKKLFEKTFNPELVELIQMITPSSEDALHRQFASVIGFIRNLYTSFDLLQPSPALLASIESLLKKCEAYECFMEMLQLIKELKGKIEFAQLYILLESLFKGECTQDQLKFVQTYAKLNEEKQLIVKLQIYDLLLATIPTKTELNALNLQEITSILKDKPYVQLFKLAIKHPKCEFTKQLKSLVFKNKIVADFDKIDYRLDTDLIHPQLNHQPMILDLLKEMNNDDLYRLFNEECVCIDNNQLKVKWNLKILEKIEQSSQALQLNEFQGQTFAKTLHLFRTTFDNRDLKMVSIDETQSEQLKIQYICKSFQLASQYYRKCKNNPQSAVFGGVNEHYMINFGKQALNWISNQQLKNQPFIKSLANEIYSFFVQAIFDERDFQSICNPNSDLSKTVMKIMIASQSLPLAWTHLKHAKILIDKWGQSIAQESEEFKIVVKMFFEAYLNKKLVFPFRIGSNSFNPVIISKVYNQATGNQLLLQLQSLLKKLRQTDGLLSHRGAIAKDFNQIATKICLFLSSKIKFQNIHQLAGVVHQIYMSYAHILPIFYSFRFWLLQVLREAPEQNLQDLVKQTSQAFVMLTSALKEKDLSYRLNSSFKEDAEMKKLVTTYVTKIRVLTNKMQLKRQKNEISQQAYQQYFMFIRLLIQSYIQNKEAVINRCLIGQGQFKLFNLLNEISDGQTIYNLLSQARIQGKIVVRYLICNSSRLLSNREEITIMRNVAGILMETIRNKNQHYQRLNFFNEMVGFNKSKNKSVIEKKQILGGLQRAHFNTKNDILTLKLDDYVPVNMVIAFYENIKPNLPQILKYIFDIKKPSSGKDDFDKGDKIDKSKKYTKEELERKKNHRFYSETRKLMDNILFPAINTSGSCTFNGKFEDKGKEDFALGIYSDQFEIITKELVDGDQLSIENINNIVQLENTHILSKFLEVMRNKASKIQESRANIFREDNRYARRRSRDRNDPLNAEEVAHELVGLGYDREVVQLALESIDQPDPRVALEWLQNHQHQFDQLLLQRVLERSQKIERKKTEPKRIQEKPAVYIEPLDHKKFCSKVMEITKKWIRYIAKKLLSLQPLQTAQKIKDLLFVFLSFFSESDKSKQICNFAEKMFKQIDELNKIQDKKSNEFASKLSLMISVLISALAKQPKIIKDFYSKSINIKILTYLEQIEDEKCIDRILQIINATLPNFATNEVISAEMKEYMEFILTNIHHYKLKRNQCYDILFKIAKSKDANLLPKVLISVSNLLGTARLKGSVFPLLNILLDADKEFTRMNVELDLKGYIYENRLKKDEKKPEKSPIFQIDIRAFSLSFSKYEKSPDFAEVAKKLLMKKKNKNKVFYFDSLAQGNSLYESMYNQNHFMYYLPSDQQKNIIDSLIKLIVNAKDATQEEDLLTQLHKLLSYYRLLIPYTVRALANEKTDFLSWLILQSKSHTKKKYAFLAFLCFKNNIFTPSYEQNKKDVSIGDYVCARFITIIGDSITDKKFEKQEEWSVFAAIYLSQITSFSSMCALKYDQESKSLNQTFEDIIKLIVQPVQFSLCQQFLYIQYKKELVQSLKGKYKFIHTGETTLEREFLYISGFYNNLSLRVQSAQEKQSLNSSRLDYQPERAGIFRNLGDQQDEDEEEEVDEMEAELDFSQMIRQRLFRRESSLRESAGVFNSQNYQNYLYPIQPEKKKAEQKDKEKENQMKEEPKLPTRQIDTRTIREIIQLFDLIFHKQGEKMDIQPPRFEIVIPKSIIKIENIPQCALKIDDINVETSWNIKKIANFQKRVIQILQLIQPQTQWQKKEKKDNRDNANDFGRRILERLQSRDMGGEHREEMLMQIQRLIEHRYADEEQANAQPRPINVNDIYQGLKQYVEPIIPKKEEPKVEKEKEQIKQIEQKIAQNQKNEEIIEEKKQEKVEEKQENKQEKIEQKQQQQHEKQEEKPQSEQKSQSNQNESNEQKIEILPVNQQSSEQNIIRQMAENLHIQSSPIQIPMVIEQSNIIPEPAENIIQEQPPVEEEIRQPPVQNVVIEANQPVRQILNAFGLPQTFLTDVGLDPQFFDSLPEDLQIEQIQLFMNQQRLPSQNNTNPNALTDLQSENMAFLTSLDPQTRLQVLMEATPEFLNSLPNNIRAQAENIRQMQIQSMIQQQELQEERNLMAQGGRLKRDLSNLIYPTVTQEEFTQINEEVAKLIINGIFIKIPKFRLSGLNILLQNKKCQQKTVSSLIYLLANIKQNEFILKNQEWNAKDLVWINKAEPINKSQAQQIKISILHYIYEHMKISPYKDEAFLVKKHSYANYFDKPMVGRFQSDEDGYYPLFQLLDSSLELYPVLATEIIKKVKALPLPLVKKVIQAMKKDVLQPQFYQNLGPLSENQDMKSVFIEQFPQSSPPAIELVGRVMKYKFCQLPYLKKIHEEALQTYKPSYNEFLNQIFSIYSIENVKQIEPTLVKYKGIHHQIIKYLYSMNRQLQKEPIGIILRLPHLLDFETKQFLFRNHPKIRRQSRARVHIEVNRANIFQQSYNQLMGRTLREIEGKMQVNFVDEPGHDAGGLTREWFLCVSREIFNPNYALFEPSSSGTTYQPNPKSYINPDHLNYFRFIGRFVGKALAERELIDAYFSRSFYKMILGQELEFKDLQQQDFEFYKSMEWLKNNKIDENMFTFSYLYDNFGNMVVKELVPGGKDIIVDQSNKIEFIEKYCLAKMRDSFSGQMDKFLQGFHELIPRECISFFEAKELELLISGVPMIDFEDFKKNTDYSGYSPDEQIIKWFWEIVSEYSQEDLAKLTQFITGTSKIPVEGFSHLIGMNGIQRISIHRDPNPHQLPKSHTCFNQLDLPSYSTKQILKEKLRICLTWGSQGFGFM